MSKNKFKLIYISFFLVGANLSYCQKAFNIKGVDSLISLIDSTTYSVRADTSFAPDFTDSNKMKPYVLFKYYFIKELNELRKFELLDAVTLKIHLTIYYYKHKTLKISDSMTHYTFYFNVKDDPIKRGTNKAKIRDYALQYGRFIYESFYHIKHNYATIQVRTQRTKFKK